MKLMEAEILCKYTTYLNLSTFVLGKKAKKKKKFTFAPLIYVKVKKPQNLNHEALKLLLFR